jgi:hypothetical protein
MSNPLVESLGFYTETRSGKTYEVLKRTFYVATSSGSGQNREYEGNHDYVTSCGIDINPTNNDLSAFELIQIDGIIKKDA